MIFQVLVRQSMSSHNELVNKFTRLHASGFSLRNQIADRNTLTRSISLIIEALLHWDFPYITGEYIHQIEQL